MAYTPKVDWKLNDMVMPADLNRIEQGVEDLDNNKADRPTDYTVSVPTAGWVGASAPYTQVIAVNGILSTDEPFVGNILSDTHATALLQEAAYSSISDINTQANAIQIICNKKKPAVDLTLRVKVVK